MPTKTSLRFYLLAFAIALLPSAAFGQSAGCGQAMAYHTVCGRIGAVPGDSGPGQAIPWDKLLANIAGTPAANTVFAGPTSGGVAAPTFRSLVGADLPVPGASSLGGVQSLTCSTSNWFNTLSISGVFGCSQPSFSDLTSQATLAQLPTIGANTALCSIAGGTPIACTKTQLTTLINPATSSLSGALPAFPGTTTTFLRGDGTYPTLNCAALSGVGNGCAAAAGQLPGTATNDNATSGNIGEFISSPVVIGSAVALTSGTPANLTSISLTAGDWDVSCQMYFVPAATTGVILGINSISTTTASLDTTPGNFGEQAYVTTGTVIGSNNFNVNAGPRRMSLSLTTAVFAVAQASFNTSTMSVYGIIRARRVR